MGIFLRAVKDRIVSKGRIRIGRLFFGFRERIDFLGFGRFARKRSAHAKVECCLEG
jgi:hypothetical protein